MGLGLRIRQGLLLCIGVLYVFVLAWFNRQPIPTTMLVHETDKKLRLRSPKSKLLGTNNRNMQWVEPAKYLESSETQGITDIESGLLYFQLNTEFKTARSSNILSGILKVYRKGLGFVRNGKGENNWEMLFVDRLPGPVKFAHLDRTRTRRENGTYGARNLAVLYYVVDNENVEYRVRVYNVEKLERPDFFDSAVKRVGDMWWATGKNTANTQDIADLANVATTHHLCPDDRLEYADSIYASSRFAHCVGASGTRMSHVDFALPGSLDVMEFSLRENVLIYSRLGDSVRFRVLELPTDSDGSIVNDHKSIVQTLGPPVHEEQRNVGHQSQLVQLYSSRPDNSVDVFLAQGSTKDDTFYFTFSLFQNITGGEWRAEIMKRYRLPVHQQFSGLSRDELRLVNDPPLYEQNGLTTAVYFKATDIAVAIDTAWFQDKDNSHIMQFQRIRESRLPYVSTLNSPVAVNMTIDESGSMLAMSTVDDELFIFTRAQLPATRKIFDYRRYFREPHTSPWRATVTKSSVDSLNDAETDGFQWKLKLTWQPSTLISPGIHWDDSFVSPDNPFAVSQRLTNYRPHESATACLRFLHFSPKQLGMKETQNSAEPVRVEDVGVIRLLALSTSGTLRLWELNSHEQSPHVLWPFVTEHWGLMFMLAAVISCCVYNERRWI